uniref:Serine peptidase inhibitor, Kunitz type 1 a n=1 Tax=Oryzias melastigma TaxID=30732 RepID=A0A3B3CH83_ORYME
MIPGASLALIFLLVLVNSSFSQETGELCFSKFKKGKEGFVLDIEESGKHGATFISALNRSQEKDCVAACCKEPKCNLAFMQRGDEENPIQPCVMFNCLYKTEYVCRFVREQGFSIYILDSVYEKHLKLENEQIPDAPPVANGGPDIVVQPSEMVALNGIQSKDDKGIVTYLWEMLSPYPFAVIEKTKYDDEVLVSNLTAGRYKFNLTVTDTIGQSDSTVVTVLVLTPEQSKHRCFAPKKVGPCRGSFPRWYYNAASQRCEKFVFGGCKKNQNNYLTEKECTTVCNNTDKRSSTESPVTEEKCGAVCGPESFTCANGCCLDRELVCDSIPQCSDGSDEQNCNRLTCRKGFWLRKLQKDKEFCTKTPDTGTCRDSYRKWYYDPYLEDCLPFNYSGCGGNENKFLSKDDCHFFCRGVTKEDVFTLSDLHNGKTGYQTGIIALKVLGVICILVLLAVVGCFIVRKRISQHLPVPVIHNTMAATEENGDSEIYNRTTKPHLTRSFYHPSFFDKKENFVIV